MRYLVCKDDAIAATNEVMRQLIQITDGTELADMLNGVAAAMIKRKIEALPAPMGILSCSDCRLWIGHDRRCGYWNHGVTPFDWCSRAERREG